MKGILILDIMIKLNQLKNKKTSKSNKVLIQYLHAKKERLLNEISEDTIVKTMSDLIKQINNK